MQKAYDVEKIPALLTKMFSGVVFPYYNSDAPFRYDHGSAPEDNVRGLYMAVVRATKKNGASEAALQQNGTSAGHVPHFGQEGLWTLPRIFELVLGSAYIERMREKHQDLDTPEVVQDFRASLERLALDH